VGAPRRASGGEYDDVADDEVAAREGRTRATSVRNAHAMLRDDLELADEPADEAKPHHKSHDDKGGSRCRLG
jgi:hypothetical protein